MKILLDHCVPRTFRRELPNHDVKTTAEMGWRTLKNGRLLAAAAQVGFEVFLTVDKNIRHQQNLAKLPLAVVLLNARTITPKTLAPLAPLVDFALASLRPGQFHEIDEPT